MAPRFNAAIARYADHPLVGNVRSVGLMGAVELIADKATRRQFDPEQKVGQYFMDRAEEHGLIMRAIGETLALSPPLIITEPQIDEMFAAFDKAMVDTEAWLKKG
jgi:4-aminobutyrate--pyruvate transaminase